MPGFNRGCLPLSLSVAVIVLRFNRIVVVVVSAILRARGNPPYLIRIVASIPLFSRNIRLAVRGEASNRSGVLPF